ncbi:hypothetical protein [Caulobacter sp. UNC358MFTsu5.1]|uniref:hypothetical protein n=1 Tax=Caulobacter sp. UNC358MFTsu5.1 TaxID=1449049 RepID=UPI000A424125|nr:hypothetical protein [Caulobacter sp. UNC358MFTsu5.1]
MTAFAALRSMAFACLITCAAMTAAWSSLRHAVWPHDEDRGDVVWIRTASR